MENQIKNIMGMQNAILSQMQNLKDLSIGTLETLKRMDGYEQAVESLKKEIATNSGNEGEKLVKE